MKRMVWAAIALGCLAASRVWGGDQPSVPAASAAGGPGSRIALVIGNGSCNNCTPLATPAHDAEDMAQALRSCGFEVIQETDCTSGSLARSVGEFKRQILKEGAALFYYSGYCVQIDRENYMVPVDASPKNRNEARDQCFAVDRILGTMGEAGATVRIVVLEACRDNPFAGAWAESGRGLARMKAGRGVLVPLFLATSRSGSHLGLG